MTIAGTTVRFKGTVYKQFDKEILVTQLRFGTLRAFFQVDHEVQRKLDPRRRAEIREFILRSLDTNEYFYFSPFIFSARGMLREVNGEFELEPGTTLYISDGQHRCSAMAAAVNVLENSKIKLEEMGKYKEAERIARQLSQIENYPVALQIYLDLSQKEERQMFSDLNSERREIHQGIVMKYDQRDEYIGLTRNVAEQLKDVMEIELELSRLMLGNPALTSLTIMRKCLVALFEGKLTIMSGDLILPERENDMEEIAIQFFKKLQQIFPKQAANRKKYVSGISGIQIALAFTVFHYVRQEKKDYTEALRKLDCLKKICSWKHDDPLFAHMYDAEGKRITGHSGVTAVKRTALSLITTIDSEEAN
ncbi:DNA sulfur modification protein DndB [Sporosarcina saromensis]|uniref:DNA sulfur modification protein DndB n=1 Tax=Sporosarcina saromensis TaxID=359365 RepID=A0ABU4G824_9BACL|nr:DNA sulfur modification protein DndB [Sporosarcina saromensis]MDW0113131.1 DNA sulfur modification protein DndB [Sporosarcina saromensis]